MNNKKSVPTGVKIIAVLNYISAALGVIFGLLFILAAGFIATLFPLFGALGVGLFIVIGIMFIGLGVLGFFIGRGLWNARPWARIISIVFACIGALMAIVAIVAMIQGRIQGSIVSNIISLVISLAIGGYLLFDATVKKTFV